MTRRAVREHAAQLLAVAIVALAFVPNLIPGLTAADPHRTASHFRFRELPLAAPTHAPARTIRQVNPSLRPIAAWVSSVGAAIAINDLDANGLDDDACIVDPRFDTVTVEPLPGTGARYRPITLVPHRLPYDARTMAPTGCLPADVDEDGRMDLIVYYWGRSPIAFLRRGRGYVPREVVAARPRWFTNAVTTADVDGDGHPDLIVGNYFADGSRVLDAHSREPVSMQTTMSRAHNGGTDHVLLWTPRGYHEARGALPAAATHGWTLAVAAQDLTGDMLPDLYIANDFGNDHLLYNRSRAGHVRFSLASGRKGFADVSSKVLGHDSFKGMGVDFGDLNADGRPDIFVSNITQPFGLEESNFAWLNRGDDAAAMRRADAPFHEGSESLGLARSGWGWDAKLGDFANDGRTEVVQATGFVRGRVDRWPELQELAMSNDQIVRDPANWPRFAAGTELSGHSHDAFFARGSDGRYANVATLVGFGREQVTRGIATADVLGNGRLDFAVANQWGASYVYMNECPAPCGRSLGLDLLLPAAKAARTRIEAGRPRPGLVGRPAIGAEVTVRLRDGRRLIGQVDGGNGHSGKRSSDLLFGLGRDARPVRVEVRWRDGSGHVHALATTLGQGWHTLLLADPEGGRP